MSKIYENNEQIEVISRVPYDSTIKKEEIFRDFLPHDMMKSEVPEKYRFELRKKEKFQSVPNTLTIIITTARTNFAFRKIQRKFLTLDPDIDLKIHVTFVIGKTNGQESDEDYQKLQEEKFDFEGSFLR